MKLRQAKKILTNAEMYHVGFESVLCDKHISNSIQERKSIKYFLKNSEIGKVRKYNVERNHSIKKALRVWRKWYGKMHAQNAPID